jgi:hypothetical protein
MKRVVAVVVSAFLTLNCAIRQVPYKKSERLYPIVVSDQVGDVVNSEERDQFGLFPAVEGFREARFYSIRDRGYELEIMTETEILVSPNHDQDAVIILQEYIDKYDEIAKDRTTWESKWRVIDYDALGIPITTSEVAVVKQLSRRQALGGGIACCLLTSLSGAALGVLIAATLQDASNEESYYPIYAIGAGVLAGLVAGVTRSMKKVSNDEAVELIKGSRKPRVVEER